MGSSNNAEGYWSLHVAVFYNTKDFHNRRWAAEEYCRYLREQGVEAYYHHAAAQSSVYVGVYPENAVVEVRREKPMAGRVELVNVIQDPDLQKAQKDFPISLHNGHKRYDITRVQDEGKLVRKRTPTPSFPVRTPRGQRQYEQFGRR
jgi:hypothetical protein